MTNVYTVRTKELLIHISRPVRAEKVARIFTSREEERYPSSVWFTAVDRFATDDGDAASMIKWYRARVRESSRRRIAAVIDEYNDDRTRRGLDF